MTRRIQCTATGTDSEAIDTFQHDIIDKISDEGYSVPKDFEDTINDGTNEKGQPTLGVNVKFDDSAEANDFNKWLKDKAINEKSTFDVDGEYKFKIATHDCTHPWTALKDNNEPCQDVDIWRLKDNV